MADDLDRSRGRCERPYGPWRFAVGDVLTDYGCGSAAEDVRFPALHIYVRVHGGGSFEQVRKAAIAVAPYDGRGASTEWRTAGGKEEQARRHSSTTTRTRRTTTAGLFDPPDRDARVSSRMRWDEVATWEPADYTSATVFWRRPHDSGLSDAVDERAGDIRSCSSAPMRVSGAGAMYNEMGIANEGPDEPVCHRLTGQNRAGRRKVHD